MHSNGKQTTNEKEDVPNLISHVTKHQKIIVYHGIQRGLSAIKNRIFSLQNHVFVVVQLSLSM